MKSTVAVFFLAVIAGSGDPRSAEAQNIWTVDERPLLAIPGSLASGVAAFDKAAGGIRLSDGSLLIADQASNTIRRFGSDGSSRGVAGGTGDGPGEFKRMTWAGRCGGDSLLVWDRGRSQASLIGSSGNVARQFRLVTGSGPRLVPLNTIACSGAGLIGYLTGARFVADVPGGTAKAYATAVLVDRAGRIRWQRDSVFSGEMIRAGRGGFPRPLGASTFVGFAGELLVIARADTASVFIIGEAAPRSITLPNHTRTPTSSERLSATEAILDQVPSPARDMAKAAIARAEPVRWLAPYYGLVTDTEAMLWVQTSPPGSDTTRMEVWNSNGSKVATIGLPSRLTMFDIGRDFILGAQLDSAGEQSIVVLRLRRR